MIADGGMPARRYPGANVAEATAMARALAAQQARVTEDMAGRLVALERDGKDKNRRLAALEDRGQSVVAIVQALAGAFSLVRR